MAGVVVGFVTVPTRELAATIAKALVSTRVAACVNTIQGITSTYMWEGKVEEDSELLLMIKTQDTMKEQVIQRVTELHTYDVPEVIFTDVTGGLPAYLKWVQTEAVGTTAQARPPPSS
ncbi:CutA1 divalent ion tolerance domain-containing protein [Salpingoeca rosetta]|uniref:CutA1 divalent ion tolerance domain-containing protein n=1 Tax=Salpingoeca rosetta (strain ATCC 50818 / BSB-021) TaxID=946362 RepID=F2UBD6_SALR5|nr:CutA1 divalent ion tolerance domain-containing protein [Salpingoeca rosetta]EGD73802.1 CutA1 divalent ion tolerance domain-containing protein [Salpingoeca rosetta]|eukprot:XP_004993365.1 CutA1 divalent ion tolerance domain-containing protein [Salpingoeca rosetta]